MTGFFFLLTQIFRYQSEATLYHQVQMHVSLHQKLNLQESMSIMFLLTLTILIDPDSQ